MLRRIASHLYWMGRRLERAEWRARLVDVNYHLLVESPPRGAEPWGPLLAITGERDAFAVRHGALTEETVLDFFVFDTDNPASVRSCLLSARESARELRHRISSELWLELNTLYLDANGWTPALLASRGVFDFFAELKERFYRVVGVIHGTLPRDLGYDFMAVGRSLEGIENVARLLDVKYHYLLPHVEDVGGPLDLLQWAAVLRSAAALEAYRKAHGNMIAVDRVVDMLVFDPSFPRSARFGAERLAAALERVGGGERSADGAGAPLGVPALVHGLAHGSARSAIAGGLHEYLLEIQNGCEAVAVAVFEEYLRFE
jgi:uncharacterized alpha-E superfamily protein